MNMTGIIFSETYGEDLDVFTHDRNLAAIPFGGRYRLVDFVLSNMVNSGINNVGVLAKQHYHSLMDHLANNQEWDLNRKNGGLLLLPPFASEAVNHNNRGKLDELRNALNYLEQSNSQYVLLADAYVVYNMDYRPMLQAHIDSGADVTIAATHEPDGSTKVYPSVLQADRSGRVVSYALNTTARPGDYVGMGCLIIAKQLLTSAIQELTAKGIYHLERDFIQHHFNRGKLTLNMFPFEGVCLRIRDVDSYFRSSMAIIDESVGAPLFRGDRPVFTRVTDEIPTYYGPECNVSSCVVADGCVLEGTVDNCVFSRGVRVCKGAVVKNCIIMQGSTVGEGAQLENVIVDKWANITASAQLKGLATNPVIIRKGAVV